MSQEENRDNPLAEIVAAHGGKIPTIIRRKIYDRNVKDFRKISKRI